MVFTEKETSQALSGVGQTWYLDNEMIVFWFTPLMLVPVHYVGRKLGFLLGAGFAFAYGIASTVLVLIFSIEKDWPFSLTLDK